MDKLSRLIERARAATYNEAEEKRMQQCIAENERYLKALQRCEEEATEDERKELSQYWENVKKRYREANEETSTGLGQFNLYMQCMDEESELHEPIIYMRAKKAAELDG